MTEKPKVGMLRFITQYVLKNGTDPTVYEVAVRVLIVVVFDIQQRAYLLVFGMKKAQKRPLPQFFDSALGIA